MNDTWTRTAALENNNIKSLAKGSDGHILIGTDNGVFDWHRNAIRHYRHDSRYELSLSDNEIWCIFADREHNIWAGHERGFSIASNSSTIRTIKLSSLAHTGEGNEIHSIYRDSRHNIWLSTDGDSLSLANGLVNDMLIDADGDIWILLFRDNVLTEYSPELDQLKEYDILRLAGGYPTHLCRDGRGRIWCAYRGGAIVFDSDGTGTTVRFPYTNGDESILATGKVGNGIWVSTLSNVWSIDGDSLSASLLPVPPKSYTAIYEDTVTGKVLLGGTDEILEVDHNNIGNTADYKTIKLILHDTGKGHLDLSDPEGDAKGMTIPYGGNVTMVVSTLDYSPDAPQRFMYKLSETPDDSPDGWIVMPEGVNTITLSDMKMGDVTIMVKTAGSPCSPTAIPLKVMPPKALSWWAVSLYVVLCLCAVTGIIWYIRRRSLRALQEQERQTALENVERKLSFLSSIFHDLKTPLAMIIGPVSLMKEKARDPESRRTLENVYDNAVRLNNMIHRTLELQHLEDGDESLLILSTFDVVESCNGIFEVFKENNTQKKFVFHSTRPQLLIEADAVKFESVITNLLSNACKYSDDGSTISCGISTNGSEVEITVSDDGAGIAEIDQPLVFQRMFRAPATSKLREGTGLGLYLIKKYLELMKGNIELYSREGQGTTFVVTLPMSEKVTQAPDGSTSCEDSGKARILIVEDNSQISGFISGILKEDYTCFTAENGRSGLLIAASIVPDLIIADEMMPVMSGLEMVRQIKKNPRLSSVPVIMLTALSDNKTENESIKLGIDVFMAKPFEPAALTGRIRHLLKERSEIKEQIRIQTIAE